jgi:hypothetical protein
VNQAKLDVQALEFITVRDLLYSTKPGQKLIALKAGKIRGCKGCCTNTFRK